MLLYTDSIPFARRVTERAPDAWTAPAVFPDEAVRRVAGAAFGDGLVHASAVPGDGLWQHLFLVEEAARSHYDMLVELGRSPGSLPHGMLFLAGSGARFHGFRNRPWAAPAGNIHLCAHLAPEGAIDRPGTCFTVLAAVSVVEAIDAVPGLAGRAGIKWVNDVLIDGAKIGGVLGYTRGEAGQVTGAVLGIGVNVETEPAVEPTPYVPRAGSLHGAGADPGDCSVGTVFGALAAALDRNYRRLAGGGYSALLSRYRERSLVVGSEVTICSEDSGAAPDVLASGRVTAIGDDLELRLEGHPEPVRRGRLILGPWKPPTSSSSASPRSSRCS